MIFINDCKEFSEETKEALCIINKSEKYILLIIFSVVISLKSLYIDKQNLINSVCYPDEPERIIDNFNLRYSSNILVSAGLIFFYCIAKKEFCENTDPDNCSVSYNYVASTLVLFAGFIRLYDILYKRSKQCNPDTQTDTDETQNETDETQNEDEQIEEELPEPDVIF